ncbi:MAG TPA: sterol desaturase family protein [Acidimicrobiales bacterium]|nr:sterol desaturase family protein [Acidimicrobiales bacterium]
MAAEPVMGALPADVVVRRATDAGSRRPTAPAASFALLAAAATVAWVGVAALQRSGGLLSGLSAGRAELLAPPVLAVVGAVTVAERLWPAERRRLLSRGHVQDAGFFLLHVTVVVALMTLFSVAFASLLEHRAGWLAGTWTDRLPVGLVFGLSLVMMDGANWIAHWADHRFTALWRMHALHHSQEELSVLTSFRAHPLSHLPGFLLASIPAFALTGHRGIAPQLVIVYVCLGTIPHANVRWSYGPLGRLVVSPAYHRLHHAADGRSGKNLGVVLTVWDLLAGRARFPDGSGWPARTGLAGRPVPVEQDAGAPLPPRLLWLQLRDPFRSGPANGPP